MAASKKINREAKTRLTQPMLSLGMHSRISQATSAVAASSVGVWLNAAAHGA